MVTALWTSSNPKVSYQKTSRPPLLPSENGNSFGHRRRKTVDVPSRYLATYASSSTSSISTSSSTSTRSSTSSTSSSECLRRCPSPFVSRSNRSASPPAKWSQSVGRKWPVTPEPEIPRPDSLTMRGTSPLQSAAPRFKGELNKAQRMMFTSPRGLSLSSQGGSYKIQASKEGRAPSFCNVRRGTPERRITATPMAAALGAAAVPKQRALEEQQQQTNYLQPSFARGSMGHTGGRKKLIGYGNKAIRALQYSETGGGASCNGGAAMEKGMKDEGATGSLLSVGSGPVISDTESVSSHNSASGAEDRNRKAQGMAAHGIVVPARFRQETTSRVQQPGTPVSSTRATNVTPSKLKFAPGGDNPSSSQNGVANYRGQLSPLRRPIRPASPSRLPASLVSYPLGSPSRARFGVVALADGNSCNTSPILGVAYDVRRSKIGETRLIDAHLLKLLYNRMLQWRFANARAENVLASQQLDAERTLYNGWITISSLRDSARAKRTELQFLMQNLKLVAILQSQATYLEEWASMGQDYSSCLLGTIDALRASTLRLPVFSGATANIQSLKDAICSAVDVMQAMASSVCYLLPKIGKVSRVSEELADVCVKECAMLEQFKDTLSTIIVMQEQELSLRAHITQQGR